MIGAGPTLRTLRWLRPLLPPAVLAAATLAGALSAPPRAVTDGEGVGADVGALDAEQLVRRYDRWFAGLDGDAALAPRMTAEPADATGTPVLQRAPADRRSAAAPSGPTIAACRSSSRSTPRTPSPAC